MRFLVVVAVAELLACAKTGTNERSDRGRGSESCRIWQDALCDHAYDKCHDPSLSTREQCDQQYQAFTCKSDDQALRCADAFESARCTSVPASCDFNDVADPAPAKEACSSLVEAFCQRYVDCGNADDVSTCVNGAGKQAFDCERAIGYRYEFESCLEQVADVDCDTFETLEPPAVCRNVIIKP
jgi:hypothetical protein